MGKLVRDKIPEIISASGKTPVFHAATRGEMTMALLDKLVEEADEFRKTPNYDELADVLEVLWKVIEYFGFRPSVIEKVREVKNQKNGVFSFGYLLDEVKDE